VPVPDSVALWLGKTGPERALLIGSLLLIMIVGIIELGDRGGGGPDRTGTPSPVGFGQGCGFGGGIHVAAERRPGLAVGVVRTLGIKDVRADLWFAGLRYHHGLTS